MTLGKQLKLSFLICEKGLLHVQWLHRSKGITMICNKVFYKHYLLHQSVIAVKQMQKSQWSTAISISFLCIFRLAGHGWASLIQSFSTAGLDSGMPHMCFFCIPGQHYSRYKGDAICMTSTQQWKTQGLFVWNWHIVTLLPFLWPKQVTCPSPISVGRESYLYSV